jgi:mannose-1-phosphate guanylyltransferase / mannose-6-phosphate isomerase
LISPVILCGGAGTRLWPLSREAFPKQFLPLVGAQSTFEQTLVRVADRTLFAEPIIVTAEPFRFIVRDQLARHGVEARVVLEPSRRDSGPAVGLAAELAQAADPRAVLYVMAADHLIEGRDRFEAAARRALALARDGHIVTFGVPPTQPATGYGYIRPGRALSDLGHAVEAFVEKPDAETAARYLEQGYLWNSGNFLFRADVFLDELRRFEPEMAAAVRRAAARVTQDLGFERVEPEAFAAAPAKSVDYAVMERTERLAVVNADYAWSDLGGWEAIWEQGERDVDRNVAKGPVVLQDTRNSFVSSEGMLTAVSGLDGVCVVVTDDAVFVSRRDAPEMKRLVAAVRARDPARVDEHSRVLRPWGWYQSVDRGDRFQVKRICVKPGGRLSLQRHYHRSEHWVVVRGTAQVTVDDQIKVVRENESIYLPLGATHRLENPGKIPLELIEVQSGSYLGEDDIVRLQDDFGRSH